MEKIIYSTNENDYGTNSNQTTSFTNKVLSKIADGILWLTNKISNTEKKQIVKVINVIFIIALIVIGVKLLLATITTVVALSLVSGFTINTIGTWGIVLIGIGLLVIMTTLLTVVGRSLINRKREW
jgi:ABC-type multidrug transport system fused ATPase/permease subunit